MKALIVPFLLILSGCGAAILHDASKPPKTPKFDFSDKTTTTNTTKDELAALEGSWKGTCSHGLNPMESDFDRLYFTGQRCGTTAMKVDTETSTVTFSFHRDFFDYLTYEDVTFCETDEKYCFCEKEVCKRLRPNKGLCKMEITAKITGTSRTVADSLMGTSTNDFLSLSNSQVDIVHSGQGISEEAKTRCESFAEIFRKPKIDLVYSLNEKKSHISFRKGPRTGLAINYIFERPLMSFQKQ